MAGNSVTMYPGDVKTGTPTVTGSDSQSVLTGGYDLSWTNDHPEFVQITLNSVQTSVAKTVTIVALAQGVATVVWTIKPRQYYGGSSITLDSDTYTVNAKRTLLSASMAVA